MIPASFGLAIGNRRRLGPVRFAPCG
jgi:hypothetical protein